MGRNDYIGNFDRNDTRNNCKVIFEIELLPNEIVVGIKAHFRGSFLSNHTQLLIAKKN